MSERAKAAIEAAKKRSAEVQQRLPQPEGRLERLKLFLDRMDLEKCDFSIIVESIAMHFPKCILYTFSSRTWIMDMLY